MLRFWLRGRREERRGGWRKWKIWATMHSNIYYSSDREMSRKTSYANSVPHRCLHQWNVFFHNNNHSIFSYFLFLSLLLLLLLLLLYLLFLNHFETQYGLSSKSPDYYNDYFFHLYIITLFLVDYSIDYLSTKALN